MKCNFEKKKKKIKMDFTRPPEDTILARFAENFSHVSDGSDLRYKLIGSICQGRHE